MKPLNRLMVVALKDALICTFAVTLYEIITELKKEWHAKYPDSVDMHVHYGRLLHLISIFGADLAFGCMIYYILNVVV